MKAKLLQLLFLCVLSIYATHTQAQNLTWAKTMVPAPGTQYGFYSGRAIATDAAGNVYTTGYFDDTVDFDPGVGVFNMTSATVNGLPSGPPSLDVFVTKTDAAGNFLWAKKVGGNIFDLGLAIKVDAAGNVYTTGFFAGFNIDFDPGVGVFNLSSSMSVEDVFILKLDTNGNFVWARNMGGVGYDRAYSIAVDASGNVYTTGIFDKTADFDPGAGTFNLVSNLNTVGSNDIFVSKLNSLGNFVWAKKFGGFGDDLGMAIAVDATNNRVFII